MYPVLLELGPIIIYSLWIFVAVGFFVALLIMNHLIKKCRLPIKFIADHSLAIFFGGIIMARLVFIFNNWPIFFHDFKPENIIRFFYIWDKGLSPWGGILGLILTLTFFAIKEKEDTKRWLDILLPSILGAIAISNIGAFLDGRNYGIETQLPWGVSIESSIYAVPIHPVQIYSFIYSALLTLILITLFNKPISKTSGQIALLSIGGYSLFRFLEEFIRGDESHYFMGFREAQIISLLGLTISIILLYIQITKSKNLTKNT